MTTRPALSEQLGRVPVIAVMRARRASDYSAVSIALAEEGIRSLELTTTTPGAIEHLATLRSELPPGTELGVGSIFDADTAARALDAGADYLVTPTTDPAVIRAAVSRAAAIIPGGLTPTELYAGWAQGAAAVKLFPAAAVGPAYIDQLHGPMPGLPVIPSGGVGIDDAAQWLAHGAVAVSVGGPLIGDAFQGGKLARLRERARRLLEAVAGS